MTGTTADLSAAQWASASAAQRSAASAVTQRAGRILLARQDSAGRWSGRSVGDVTLDAEALLVREFLGVARPEVTKAAAQQIRSMQQPEGNWIGGAEPGRSGDLAASVLAYLALRLAGDSPDAYHLAVAAGWIRDAGGLAAAGLVGRGWLAVFGLTGWDEVRVPAPEFVYLPARYAPGGGDWTGLSRQAVVSLTVIGNLRRVRQLPVDLSELRPGGLAYASRPARLSAPLSAAHRAALRRCGQWLVSWQQRAGLPMENRQYCALSLVALRALGYPVQHPVVSGGLSWLDSVTARPRHPAGPAGGSAGRLGRSPGTLGSTAGPAGGSAGPLGSSAGPAGGSAGPAGPVGSTAGPLGSTAGSSGLVGSTAGPLGSTAGSSGLVGGPTGSLSPLPGTGAVAVGGAAGQGRIAAMRQPPVRDTSLTVVALADAGLPPGHPAMLAAGNWLLAQRITGPPEGAGPLPGATVSGWSFGRDGYPVAADTAEVLIALSRVELREMTGEPAITASIRWLNHTQGRDGSWGHSAGTTALVVQALATHSAPDAQGLRRGLVWLLRAQLADGSWPGRHGAAELEATTDVLAALLVAGVVPAKPVIRSAVDWLLSRQNPDGGWPSGAMLPAGADREAVSQPLPPVPGAPSDAGGTARAVGALLAVGCLADAGAVGVAVAVDAGCDWLMRAQRADGGWSDRADAAAKPAARNSPRRRGSLLPGILLPLAALGQYAACRSASPIADARTSFSAGAIDETVLAGQGTAGASPPAGV
jgi:squalene-hopene/tetraprenyl-beta-curcumene cyclase